MIKLEEFEKINNYKHKNKNHIDDYDDYYDEELNIQKIKVSEDHVFLEEKNKQRVKTKKDLDLDKSCNKSDRAPAQITDLNKKIVLNPKTSTVDLNVLFDIGLEGNFSNEKNLKGRSSNFRRENLKLILNEKKLVGQSFMKNYLLCKFSCFDFKFELNKKTIVNGIIIFFQKI